MIFIAHRGNTHGRDIDAENTVQHIDKAISEGFDVEVDVWYENGLFYLGHDEPKTKIGVDYLELPQLWCHAKNILALHELLQTKALCFWHQNDDVTLTSGHHLWTFPHKALTPSSIAVMPLIDSDDWLGCFGVCSDNVVDFKAKYRHRV